MSVKITRLLVLVAVVLTMCPPPSRAEVPYLSGGVGLAERDELLTKEKDYDLKVVTAEVSGNYVGNARVVIESAGRQPVLETPLDGPILLVKLAPGTYTIRATLDDKTLTKSVSISGQELRKVDFRWNAPHR